MRFNEDISDQVEEQNEAARQERYADRAYWDEPYVPDPSEF